MGKYGSEIICYGKVIGHDLSMTYDLQAFTALGDLGSKGTKGAACF